MTTPLNPGIRRTVAWLNAEGFTTTDSGDGVTHDFECDRGYGYVEIVTEPVKLVAEAARLAHVLKSRGVNLVPIGNEPGSAIMASFDPADGTALLSLSPIVDADITWPEDKPS